MSARVLLPMLLALPGLAWSASPASPSVALKGSVWEAEKLHGRDATTVVVIEFRGERELVGNLGCNLVKASYKQTPSGELRIESITTSKRTCPSTVVAEQERYVAAFRQVRSLRRVDDRLWLYDEQKQLTVQFMPPTGPVDCH